jgi:cell division protein FtsB
MNASAPDERLVRENAYLRQRNAQLQDDVTALTAEAKRLRQIVERVHGRAAARSAANPLSGGQSS